MSPAVPTVVLLHGFTGSPASFDAVVGALGDRTRVLRPALLGHGADVETASFDDEVARLVKIAEAAPAPRVLVGYSLGGRVALGMLCAKPRAFARAILAGAHPGFDDPAEREVRRAHDATWVRRLREEGLPSFVEAWDAQPLFASQARASDAARAAQRAIRLGHDAEGLARSLEVLGLGEMPSYWERLSALNLPLMLVAGALDPRFAAIARAMHARLPSSEAVEVPNVGHNVLLEAPYVLAAKIRKAIDAPR